MIPLGKTKTLKYGQEIRLAKALKARKQKDGSVSYIYHGRVPRIKSIIRIKIGSSDGLSAKQLEEKYLETRKLVAQGIDPREHEQERRAKQEQIKKENERNSITLSRLIEEYQKHTEIAEKGVASKTIRDRRNSIENVFKPFMGRPIQLLTGEQILKIRLKWLKNDTPNRATPKNLNHHQQTRTQFKKACRNLKAIFKLAVMEGWLVSNPFDTKSLKSLPLTEEPQKKEDYLTQEESVELVNWLSRLTSEEFKAHFQPNEITDTRKMMYDAIYLELLTGLRLTEILALQWDNIYLEKNQWRDIAECPFFKYEQFKNKKFHVIPITNYMQLVFKNRLKYRSNSRYVFPSTKEPDKYITTQRYAEETLQRLLGELRFQKRRKVEQRKHVNLTAGILRHTFQTIAKDWGISDEDLNQAMGRKNKTDPSALHYYVGSEASRHFEVFDTVGKVVNGDITRNKNIQSLYQEQEMISEEEELTVEDGGYVLPEKERR